MKKKNYLFFIFLFSILYSFAQKEGNIWYFGYKAGVNFNTSPPSALTNGLVGTDTNSVTPQSEGSAVVCDKTTGELLFYTDGVQVWNKNHTPMPNGTGLLGSVSSTQSSMIIPKPGSGTLYYIFTTDCEENNYTNGLRYSIVDMTLNGNLGDVTTKNTSLVLSATERQTAIRQANGYGVWIITQKTNTNNFYEFLLTATGICGPYIYAVGAQNTNSAGDANGEMKASPDGKKLAYVNYSAYTPLLSPDTGFVELYDFDDTTGVISNPKHIPDIDNSYGVCFSPDNSKLYATASTAAGDNILYQFDSLSKSAAVIISSKKQIYTTTAGSDFGSIQIAPDGKLYMGILNFTPLASLATISAPNASGTACNFIYNAFSLGGKSTFGALPALVVKVDPFGGNPAADFSAPATICVDTAVRFTNLSTGFVTGWSWNFGESSSSTNTSSIKNPSHLYGSSNSYIVTLTITACDNTSSTASKTIDVTNCGSSSLSIPNIFSPNADAKNDLFAIKTTGIESLMIRIYDRWGILMYSSDQFQQSWDGTTTAGMNATDGIYFYSVKAQGADGKKYELSGTLSLVR